ncbi:hypothetical protein JRO89_XS02G0030800 [Xanthoceras sorbifolium]|uniref:Uncharacterized protein n=1 Tax=Xanthoceras sorbifolium TaxID=99658 RepID=A0ABQ8IEK5_9ROSI|nr:hypothetical protein JRO89_XS02G0030800 [Xanthoceras sorbifolium]
MMMLHFNSLELLRLLFDMGQVKGMGTLVLCYNNIQVFKDKVKLRRDKNDVEMHDPNAMKTLSELNKIQEICKKSGLLITRKFYIIKSEQGYNSYLVSFHANLICLLSTANYYMID